MKRGFVVPKYDMTWIIAKEYCDLFVMDLDGHLRILGCHEDEARDGERLVWMPN
jgi:hypothetical protein